MDFSEGFLFLKQRVNLSSDRWKPIAPVLSDLTWRHNSCLQNFFFFIWLNCHSSEVAQDVHFIHDRFWIIIDHPFHLIFDDPHVVDPLLLLFFPFFFFNIILFDLSDR